jgi:hypothetical protein
VSPKPIFCHKKATLRSYNGISANHVFTVQLLTNTNPRAGTSVVSVQSAKEGGSVNFELWASDLSEAMSIFFDCRHYTTTFGRGAERIEFNFYGTYVSQSPRSPIDVILDIGLAEQTVVAAYAMEMVRSYQVMYLRDCAKDYTQGI